MKSKQDIIVYDVPFPQTEEYERNVLADAICFPELLGDIIPIIHPDFFTTDSRRRIWETIVARYNNGEEVSFAIAPVIGHDFITEVVPYTHNLMQSEAPFRAQVLRDEAAKRRAYFAAAEFVQKAVQPGITEQDLVTSVEQFTRAIEGPAPLQGEKKLAQVLDEVKAEVKRVEAVEKAGGCARVTTGFANINEVLYGGMKPGQLVILAARPSVGKTALMLQMARAAAADGHSVQIFSLEMRATELAERLLYGTGEVRPYQVNHGQVEWQAYARAEKELKPLPIYLNDFSRSLDEIVSRLVQAVKKERCDVAYIDYLGLMREALNFGQAKLYQVIGVITGTLKAVAKRLQIPIVLLCQLNREAAREKRSPQLYDLRDSGSIEQDADVVFMLESRMETERRIVVWLRKNRGGKKEYGFVLVPSDTFSSFEEGGVEIENGQILPYAPRAQEPVTFHNEAAERDFDDEQNKDLPF